VKKLPTKGVDQVFHFISEYLKSDGRKNQAVKKRKSVRGIQQAIRDGTLGNKDEGDSGKNEGRRILEEAVMRRSKGTRTSSIADGPGEGGIEIWEIEMR